MKKIVLIVIWYYSISSLGFSQCQSVNNGTSWISDGYKGDRHGTIIIYPNPGNSTIFIDGLIGGTTVLIYDFHLWNSYNPLL